MDYSTITLEEMELGVVAFNLAKRCGYSTYRDLIGVSSDTFKRQFMEHMTGRGYAPSEGYITRAVDNLIEQRNKVMIAQAEDFDKRNNR